jgi:peptidoglycan/LPS O-acetylase OafA/YrhL
MRSNTPTPAAAPRLPFLDGLRVAAFALLIPYHVGMYYVTWDWHVKSARASATLEPFMLLTAPWRLGLLFLVGGVACQALYSRRGLTATLKDRSRRLLWPLLFGMAVIVPPQAYVEVLSKAPQLLPGGGGYLDFWWAYLHGGQYCRAADCLSVPTWNHLWFLPYLWWYAVLGSVLAAVVAAVVAAVAPRLTARPRPYPPHPTTAVPLWVWLLLPAGLLALLRVGVFPDHPSTHNFSRDLYNHGQYGLLFALGWLSRTPLAAGLWPATLRWRWHSLAAALLGWAVLLAYFVHYADAAPPTGVLVAQRLLWGAMSWWAIAAACGWSQRAFPRESPALRAASGGVFCFYVLHQTLIVVLSQALKPLNVPWGAEALLLIALTTALCWLAYRVLRHLPVLRVALGISAPRATRPGASDTATVLAGLGH